MALKKNTQSKVVSINSNGAKAIEELERKKKWLEEDKEEAGWLPSDVELAGKIQAIIYAADKYRDLIESGRSKSIIRKPAPILYCGRGSSYADLPGYLTLPSKALAEERTRLPRKTSAVAAMILTTLSPRPSLPDSRSG